MLLSSKLILNIIITIFTVIFLVLVILYLLTKKIYNVLYGRRYDKTFLHFFSHKDFDGLNAEEIEFKSTNDNTLKGKIYYYNNDTYKGLVVVSHGLGVGHLQYATEINHFARLGFKVLSFDNTGCALSEGEEINGLPQGILDLKSCLDFIKTRPDLNTYQKVLFGHSWGGYSCLNVLPFVNEEDKISCVVTMGAPYNSSEITYEILKSNSKILSFTKPFIYMIEKSRFGLLYKMNTLATLSNTKIDTLLVHGTKDNIVNYESNFKFVENLLDSKHVKFLTVNNKMHRPNISDEATEYEVYVNTTIAKFKKEKATKEVLKDFHDQIDYHKMVEFDDNVMNEIDNFILEHFKF